MKQIIWFLIAGTRGGGTRGRIIDYLMKQPANTNKISQALDLDYKTVQHHLKILEKNRMVIAINKGAYGAAYVISEEMKAESSAFAQIWEKSGKKYLNR